MTTTGKAIASANATTHALAARGVLLPSERAEDYEANLQAWFVALLPRTPGEGQLAARVADVGFRMHRLSRLKERMVNAALERRLAESPLAKALQDAQEALQATRSVAVLAEEVKTARAGKRGCADRIGAEVRRRDAHEGDIPSPARPGSSTR
jgi:hypothetical protein